MVACEAAFIDERDKAFENPIFTRNYVQLG
jgi:hypothetical protein